MVTFYCAYCHKLNEKNCSKTAKRLREGLPCYCNKSCANSARVPTEEHKQHTAESMRRFRNNYTGSSIRFQSKALSPEEKSRRAFERRLRTIDNQIIHNMMNSNIPGAFEQYKQRKAEGLIQKYTYRKRQNVIGGIV